MVMPTHGPSLHSTWEFGKQVWLAFRIRRRKIYRHGLPMWRGWWGKGSWANLKMVEVIGLTCLVSWHGLNSGWIRTAKWLQSQMYINHVNLSDCFRWVSDGGYVQGLLYEVPSWSFRRVSDGFPTQPFFTHPAECIAAVQTMLCNFEVVLIHTPWSRHKISPC